MDVVTALLILSIMLAGLNIMSWLALRFLVANLYIPLRDEREALLRGRDGWRGVAERTLLVARRNDELLKRAAHLVDLPLEAAIDDASELAL
jgi:hypothetical protein